ncbi:MAG: hypothetical protein HN341_18330 [Verrucomicrobia bacterium]|jgi:hypothetical protein|nr:hypothetical protein [Verrucomicrobiota bacterium]
MNMCRLFVLCLLMGSALSVEANAPAKKPTPKRTPKAKKVVDPKQAAEDARFTGTKKSLRPALLELDAINKKLVDAWVELRDAQLDGTRLDLVWGVRARRDAEKRKASLSSLIPRLERDLTVLSEKQEKRFDRELVKLRKTISKLADRPRSSSERLNEIQAKELAGVKAEEEKYENLISAIDAMVDQVSGYKPGGSTDRLTQIGVDSHDKELRTVLSRHKSLVDTAYDVKDLKADIAALKKRQAAKTDWTSRDDSTLRTVGGRLEMAGRKIEKLVERERKKLKRDIDKAEDAIKRLDARLSGLSDESRSYERYTNEKWDIESELLGLKNLDGCFAKLADWKEPVKKPAAAAKKPAKKPAKKKAGH